MDGESEFRALGLALHRVRSVVTEPGSTSALILTRGSATVVEHDAEATAAIVSYLRANGVAVYGREDEIPAHHLPDAGPAVVVPIDL